MKACTRCGAWHDDAEKTEGRRLSCTEVKQYWGRIKREHRERFGHTARIVRNDNGEAICVDCGRILC